MAVWNAPENDGLRRLRNNPNVLKPGDVLFIPERTLKTQSVPTDQTHRFIVKTDILKLRFVIHDFDNQPIPNLPTVLEVEGDPLERTTNSKGIIERPIPRTAQTGHLRIPKLGLDLPLAIGHLDPATEESGWRARLINLGYFRGAVDDDDEAVRKLLTWALEEFQCDFGLHVSGEADAATLAKLEAIHGS
jgi:hypothetical protein